MLGFFKRIHQKVTSSSQDNMERVDVAKEPFSDEVFKTFVDLRDKLREAKRNKNYELVIELGQAILNLEPKARFLNIHIAGFQEDMGDAFVKLGYMDKAISLYSSAKSGLVGIRNSGRIAKPDDWLDNIGIIDRKLAKLRLKS